MKIIHNLVIFGMIAGVGIVSVVFLSHVEEVKSSQKAAFDSLLVLEPVDITCIYCGQVNHTNMKWVRDSLK